MLASGKVTLADAQRLDAADPLGAVRELFETLPETIFLDANSVGPMPKATRAAAAELLDDWVQLRRRGWSLRPWLDLPSHLGEAVAPMIGAAPGTVVFCDSTTLNQFKAVSHALAINAGRTVILTQNGNFPTDVHVLQGIAQASGGRLSIRYVDSENDAVAALDDTVAVAALSHVDYRSGERWDMARVTAAAHAKGALAVWDLSHSAGAVPVDLTAANADLAIGCGYKYLCSGPGGPAYIYARPGIADLAFPALAGWMGHADVFGFARDYAPHDGVKRFLTGTPLVGADALASPLLDIWPRVNPKTLWEKHRSLTDLLIALLEQECGELGVTVNSPRDWNRRGGNVTFSAPGAGSVVEALIDADVVSSFRKPSSIRFGVSPLVIRHIDVFEAVQRLKRILAEETWRQPNYAKVSV
ncbi:MAG: aminotransferase class V-fold PLP-dependent enzyme [Parvibaculaceae bacterium]